MVIRIFIYFLLPLSEQIDECGEVEQAKGRIAVQRQDNAEAHNAALKEIKFFLTSANHWETTVETTVENLSRRRCQFYIFLPYISSYIEYFAEYLKLLSFWSQRRQQGGSTSKKLIIRKIKIITRIVNLRKSSEKISNEKSMKIKTIFHIVWVHFIIHIVSYCK